ncbi:MAG: hypothetical protein IT449_06235 [Phycisphaerales bacterium]|nr:hypothetical protein [Phycisphaerales bacterium]
MIPSTREVVGLPNQILHRRAEAPAGERRSQRMERADRESRLGNEAVAGWPRMPEGARVIDASDRGSDIRESIASEVAAPSRVRRH